MATPYIQTLKAAADTGGFSLMSTWESATQCNLTLTTTKVFSHGGITGTIANNATVTGQTSGATGVVVAGPTSTQILLDGITGAFQSGEVVQVSAGNSVTISDAGDSASVVLECDAGTYDEGTAITTVSGWTTNATNFITIRAAQGGEHKGVPGAGAVFAASVTPTSYAWSIAQAYTVVQGVEFRNTSTVSCWVFRFISPGTNCVADGLIIKATSAPSNSSYCLGLNAASNIVKNTLILDGKVGVYSDNWSSNSNIMQNCTIVNPSQQGINRIGSDSVQPSNVVVYSAGTCFAGNTTTTGTKNASNDSTAIGTSPTTGIASTVFKNYAGGNYRPAIADTVLKGQGTDLSLGTDIRGEAVRYISIGAYDSDILHRFLKRVATLPTEYELMSTWETTEQADLTALGDRAMLECYKGDGTATGNWQTDGSLQESASVSIDGWTTDASNTIAIKAAAGNEHGGVIGAGFFMKRNTGYQTVVSIAQGDVVVEDWEVYNESSNGHGMSVPTATKPLQASRMIFRAGNDCVRTSYTDKTFENCLAVGGTAGSCFAAASFNSPIYRNCTAIGGNYGFRHTSGGEPSLTNCVAVGAATLDYSLAVTTGMSHCASGDTSAAGTTSAVTGVVLTDDEDFVKPSIGDYQPTSSGKLADPAGTDLSAYFLDDITGTAR